MTEKKRRPPSLSDAIFSGSGGDRERAQTASLDFRNFTNQDHALTAVRSQFQRSVQRLHADFEGALQRHQDELLRCAVDCMNNRREKAVNGWRSAGSVDPISMVGSSHGMPAGFVEVPGNIASRTATPKLNPPPHASHSSVGHIDGIAHVHHIAKERAKAVTGIGLSIKCAAATDVDRMRSPDSLSSTRTSSRELPLGVVGEGLMGVCEDMEDGSDAQSFSLDMTLQSQSARHGAELPQSLRTVAQSLPEDREASPQPPKSAVGAWLPLDDGQTCGFASHDKDDDTSSCEDPCSHVEVLPSVETEFPQAGRYQKKTSTLELPDRRTRTTVFSPLSKRKIASLEADQARFEKFVKGQAYELLNAVIIIVNAAFIVWETQRRSMLASSFANEGDIKSYELVFEIVACIFCVLFVTDVVLRMIAERQHFFRSRECGWNLFDVFVSLTQTAEVAVNWWSHTNSSTATSHLQSLLRKFSMLRIVRLLRVVRSVRAIAIIRVIRELRLMVFSLTGAWRSFMWAVVLMLIILTVFAVFFTDGVVAHCVNTGSMDAEHTRELRERFGTLSAAVTSLYMAMSGGEDWATLLKLMDPLPYEYSLLFLGFITFAILALMNVVTAVFVSTAMQGSASDRELVVLEEIENKRELICIMQQVFDECDTDDNQSISLEEFVRHIEDERVLAYLRSLEIEVHQVESLFNLLDEDKTGGVDVEEFVGGCMKLRGGATKMDLALLNHQVEWIVSTLSAINAAAGANNHGGLQLSRSSSTSRADRSDHGPSLAPAVLGRTLR